MRVNGSQGGSEKPVDREIFKQRSLGVARRQGGRLNRPVDTDGWIIPAKTHFILRRIGLGAFVMKKGGFTQHRKAMRKPRGNIELTFALGGEIQAQPAAEGGRIAPNVDRHVENLALPDRDEFALGVRLLKVQTPQRAASGKGKVVLDEIIRDARVAVSLAVPGLHKEPAMIAENIRFDDQQTLQIAFDDIHWIDK